MLKDYVVNWPSWAFVISFLLGAVLHWARARVADPTIGGLLEYWIGGTASDKGASACTLVVMLGTILTTLAVGLDPKSNIYMVSYNALLAGFAIDSFFQKTPPSEPTVTTTVTERIQAGDRSKETTTTTAAPAAPVPAAPQLFPSGSGTS